MGREPVGLLARNLDEDEQMTIVQDIEGPYLQDKKMKGAIQADDQLTSHSSSQEGMSGIGGCAPSVLTGHFMKAIWSHCTYYISCYW